MWGHLGLPASTHLQSFFSWYVFFVFLLWPGNEREFGKFGKCVSHAPSHRVTLEFLE